MRERGAAGPGDVILAGFRIFAARWQDLVKIAAVTVLPVAVVGVVLLTPFTPETVGDIMANQTAPEDLEQRLQEVEVEEWIRWGVGYGIYAIASWIVSTFAFGASLIVVHEHLQNRSIGAGEALRAALPRLPRLLLLVLLVWLLSGIGLLLCLLPGIWLLTSWFVAPVAMFHEGLPARRSMGRSFRLVRNRFWPTLLVVALAFGAVYLLQAGANAIASILLAPVADAGRLYFAGLMLAGGVIGLAAIGVLAAIATELYLDLVARAERGGEPGTPTPPPTEAFS